MADYHIDLGYDVNAVTSGGPALLQWGLVAVSGPAPSTPYGFQQGDTIEFYVYDVSTIANPSIHETSTPGLGSPFISSMPSDSPNPNSNGATRPCDNLLVLNGSQLNSAGNSNSTIFGAGPFPVWVLAPNGSSGTGPISLPVVHDGVFELTLQISVNGKTYAANLIMAVGA